MRFAVVVSALALLCGERLRPYQPHVLRTVLLVVAAVMLVVLAAAWIAALVEALT